MLFVDIAREKKSSTRVEIIYATNDAKKITIYINLLMFSNNAQHRRGIVGDFINLCGEYDHVAFGAVEDDLKEIETLFKCIVEQVQASAHTIFDQYGKVLVTRETAQSKAAYIDLNLIEAVYMNIANKYIAGSRSEHQLPRFVRSNRKRIRNYIRSQMRIVLNNCEIDLLCNLVSSRLN